MRKLLLIVLLTFSFQAYSQITITQAEMPFAGDELYRTRANNNPFLNYGATGANYVWNFNNLVATTQDSALYQSVSSTNFIYALVYADIFFNPNRANHAKAGTDIPFSNLLPIGDPYTFYYRNSSIYKKVGYGAELAGIPLPIIYTDHDEIYNLPLNYGDSDSTFSSYNVSIPTLAYYGYDQSRLNNVDGWGVITTPSGTFDVLRVKTTLLGKDTVQLDTLNVGFAIDRPVVNEYKWLANNIRVPILQINTTTIFGFELITDIFFYDQQRSISVAAPLATTLCPGSTIQINYDATGAFNPGGFFSAANVFRAQLSDANGSFATPLNIGSITSTQSGVINATIPANIPLGSGYRIRVISTNPAFTGNDNGFDLTIGAAPVASAVAAGQTVFCAGGSVLLNSGTDPSYSYQWQLNGNDINGEVSSDLVVVNSGNYSVVVTNSCGSSTSASIPVVVNDLPVHSFTQSSLISCNGAAVSINSQNTSGQTSLTYQWYLDGNLLAGEISPDITSSLPGNYTLEISNTLTGCAYTTTSVQVIQDIITMPVITSNSSTTFCDGGSVLLEILPEPSVSYQWYVDGVIIPGATGSDYLATATGEYTVHATNLNGCSVISGSGVEVIVYALPNAVAITSNGATNFCQGNSILLEFIPEPGVTYQWQIDGVDIAGANATSLTATTTGNYTVVPTSIDGCLGAISNAIAVSVDPLPIVPAITAAGPTTFCDGGSALLEITPEPGISYQWFVDGVSINGAITSTYSATASGSYSVVATSLSGCTSVSNSPINVTVNPVPSQPVLTALGSTTFCQGANVTLNFISEPGVNYQWQLDGVDIPGANSTSLLVTTTGNYTVVSSSIDGCAGPLSNVISVTVDPLPTIPSITAAGPTTFCDGGSALLEITPEPGVSYQWFVDGVSIAGATTSSYSAIASGNYTVVATSLSGCTSVANPGVNVTVDPIPAQPVLTALGATTFCQGGSVTLSFIPEPGVTYQWQVDGIDIPGATNAGIFALSSGFYTVNAIGLGGCNSTSVAGVNVVVHPLPATPTITVSGSTTFCDGGSVTLSVPIQTGMAYQWTLDNTNINGANSNQYTVTSNSGFYTVNVIDSNGCASISTITYQVIVNPLPAAPVITQSFDTLFASGSGSFQWYLNGNPLAGATLPYFVTTANGNYTVTVSDINGCENISAVFPYNSVGITEISNIETLVYPNPSSGMFNVVINSSMIGKMNYSIIDITGKIVESGEMAEQKTVIDISNNASGIYILRIQGGDEITSIKLSKF